MQHVRWWLMISLHFLNQLTLRQFILCISSLNSPDPLCLNQSDSIQSCCRREPWKTTELQLKKNDTKDHFVCIRKLPGHQQKMKCSTQNMQKLDEDTTTSHFVWRLKFHKEHQVKGLALHYIWWRHYDLLRTNLKFWTCLDFKLESKDLLVACKTMT